MQRDTTVKSRLLLYGFSGFLLVLLLSVSDADVRWLRTTLDREGKRSGTRVEMDQSGTLDLRWD